MSRYTPCMATKKGKKKVTKKARPAPKKRGKPAPAKKVARAKKGSSRRPAKAVPAKKKTRTIKSPRKAQPKARPSAKASAPARPKKKPAAKSKKRASVAASRVRRFDRPGHLDPKYAAGLREQSGAKETDPHAFLDGPRSPNDDLAEERGESVVEKATTGEDGAEESLDQVVPEEEGGPFVETTGATEFGEGADASNPKGAFREPFPTT
jgi:hypothetical protein